MVRPRFIAFSALIIAAVSSCSKSEFEDLYFETEQHNQEARKGESSSPSNTSSGNFNGAQGNGQSSVLEGEGQAILRSDSIQILIKEVTDGDDEADQGDDSKKTD
jgi:hypothetical protein